MATPVAVQTHVTPRRSFWITDAALSNWREKVKNFPHMENERLSYSIDEMVSKAIAAGKVEEILDGEEEARLVHIGEGDDLYFALVKKSINPGNGDHAVVTIMTAAQVDKKRQNQWSKPDISIGGMSEAIKKQLAAVKAKIEKSPTPIADVPKRYSLPDKASFLISYMPFRQNQGVNKREIEEWGTAEEVEARLLELKVIPGTLRVYKELALGYRIIE